MKFELRITTLYIIVGAAWILFSDQLVALLTQTLPAYDAIQTYKGWFYVVFTGLLLYVLLHRENGLRQAAVQRLKASERQFRDLFADNPLPICIYHQQTLQILDVNDAAVAEYGYEVEEFRKLTLNDIRAADPPADATMPQTGGLTHVRKDGRHFPVELMSHEVDFNGELAVLLVVQNITQREQLMLERTEGERLRIALNKEIEVREMKNRFMSMVAHEFRTPLTTIALSADLLLQQRQKLSEDRQSQHYHKIQNQVKRLTEMMEDILRLTRTEVIKTDFKPQPCNAVELITALVEEMRLNLKAGQQIAYQSSVDPSPMIDVDTNQIQQALSNILANAIKYSPENTVITVHAFTDQTHFVVRVSDQGIGIPQRDLPRLFEPFQRAENVGRIPGTGLGLAITKQAIEMHGGEINVESDEGVGSTFTVRLAISSEEGVRH